MLAIMLVVCVELNKFSVANSRESIRFHAHLRISTNGWEYRKIEEKVEEEHVLIRRLSMRRTIF